MNHVSDGDENGRTLLQKKNQIDLADWSVCVVVVKFWKMSIAVNLLNEIRMPVGPENLIFLQIFLKFTFNLNRIQKICKVEEEEEEEA
ncbi:hypothetical protein T02_5838 [Trichinella nativa]|uniref:Uncharacterized protein n=1 Tax=Trichinella nativa TaxID=6335 RepID=A0A0V1L7W7_9BILA|nr:hypothetical protein T02_5838 [Trichinella nativa]